MLPSRRRDGCPTLSQWVHNRHRFAIRRAGEERDVSSRRYRQANHTRPRREDSDVNIGIDSRMFEFNFCTSVFRGLFVLLCCVSLASSAYDDRWGDHKGLFVKCHSVNMKLTKTFFFSSIQFRGWQPFRCRKTGDSWHQSNAPAMTFRSCTE